MLPSSTLNFLSFISLLTVASVVRADLISSLFPLGQPSASWSTAAGSNNRYPLSDGTLRPRNIITALPHDYGNVEGKATMEATFPEGTWGLSGTQRGGISFYAPGPAAVDLSTAKEATFGYSLFFQDGWEWNMGGKLPGLYGGNNADGAVGCSGGSRNDACFSARLMWRTNGRGELYAYLPPSYPENDNVCNVPPESHCNPTYGASVGRGAWSFTSGQWNTISQRVRLNDAGRANGEMEIFANGRSVVNVGGLVLRDSSAGRIRGIQMQSFFGGTGDQWGSPQDQSIFFADFSVAITERL